MSKFLQIFLGLAVVVTLTACGAAPEDELRQWMAVQKSEIHPKITPISEPKLFKPELYAMVSDVEPFSSQKLTQALKKDSTQAASNGALIAPELARRKEPLEEFPLDTMALVGSMVKAGQAGGPGDSRQIAVPSAGRVTIWGKTMGESPKLPKPKSACAKSCKTPPVSGLSALQACSCKRGQNENE